MSQGDQAAVVAAHAEGQVQRWREQISAYATRARAPRTLAAYEDGMRDFRLWADGHGLSTLPAAPAVVAAYLVDLARAGAAVSTMAQRRAAIRYTHKDAGLTNPFDDPEVARVWEGILRTHTTPAQQAKPLMPPLLWDVLEAIPPTRSWVGAKPDEVNLAGVRDRALLLVGFVGALRKSELVAMNVKDLTEHPNGRLLAIPRSKTNQTGEHPHYVVLPHGSNPTRSPVEALTQWLNQAGITSGPVWRAVSKGNRVLERRLSTDAVGHILTRCLTQAGLDPTGYSAHSLRAGFVTYAHQRGASDRAIAHQTRHRSLASITGYIRHDTAWTDNAANDLGL